MPSPSEFCSSAAPAGPRSPKAAETAAGGAGDESRSVQVHGLRLPRDPVPVELGGALGAPPLPHILPPPQPPPQPKHFGQRGGVGSRRSLGLQAGGEGGGWQKGLRIRKGAALLSSRNPARRTRLAPQPVPRERAHRHVGPVGEEPQDGRADVAGLRVRQIPLLPGMPCQRADTWQISAGKYVSVSGEPVRQASLLVGASPARTTRASGGSWMV